MNIEQIMGILRAILAAGGGLLVQKGYVDSATLTTVIGAVVTLATAAWSIISNRSGKFIQ